MSQMKSQIDMQLTGVASGYFPKGMVSEMIFPMIQAAQYSGKLGKYGTSHLRIENSLGGGRGKYRQVETRQYSTTGFQIEGHGLTDLVTDEDYRNVLDPFDAERDAVLGLVTKLFLEKEKLMADSLLSTSLFTQNVTLDGDSQFSSPSTSDPIGVINTGKNTVLDSVGMSPNVAVMDVKVARALRYHPQLLDQLGYKMARPGGLSNAELAAALELDRVIVGDARYESAKEGQASSLASIWGKDISLLVAPDSAAVGQVSAGYWVRLAGSSPRQVSKEPKFNPPGSMEVLCEDKYDLLLSNQLAGYLIKAAIA